LGEIFEALGINLGYLVSQIINFTILAVLLYRVAYKPVLGMMDERRSRIEKGMKDAEDAAKKAAEAQEEFERVVAEARREAQNTISQATAQGEKAKEEILAQARNEAQALVEKAKDEIRLERQQLLSELQDEVTDLSIALTEKVIGKVVDEQVQRELIHDFLQEG
jgi:F-type H+-transporting ATPase subunit b